MAKSKHQNIAIEVQRLNHVFFTYIDDTLPLDKHNWLKRKANVAILFENVKKNLEHGGMSLKSTFGLDNHTDKVIKLILSYENFEREVSKEELEESLYIAIMFIGICLDKFDYGSVGPLDFCIGFKYIYDDYSFNFANWCYRNNINNCFIC